MRNQQSVHKKASVVVLFEGLSYFWEGWYGRGFMWRSLSLATDRAREDIKYTWIAGQDNLW